MKKVEIKKGKFVFSGLRMPVKAEVIGDYMMSLYKESNNQLTPDFVVSKSRAKSSVLHRLFEWDNERAGHKWRLKQARDIINCISVVKEDKLGKELEVKAFVSVQIDSQGYLKENYAPKNTSYYVSVDDAMSNPNSRDYTLRMAYRDLEMFNNKYQHLKELAKLFKFIDKEVLTS
jgi:hypothetical protein